MLIGLLTLPIETGYGSIMQAFALKTALERHGHKVVLIRRLRKKHKLGIKRIIRRVIKKYLFLKRNTVIFIDCKERKEFPIITQNTQRFVEDRLRPYSPEYFTSEDFKGIEKQNLDAVVVGSDQVWRPGCMDFVEDYFLFGISKTIKRYAYAASFGVGEWCYSSMQTKHCKTAIKDFCAVSVREKSGVDLCRTHLDATATFVLDPTLLFDSDFYISLIDEHDFTREHKICAFILDRTKSKLEFLDKWSRGIDKDVFFAANNTEDREAPLEDRIAPSVESWIDAFYSADCIFTDSFHGCVFSIIFRKPFYVYVNKSRGSERFVSLLELFGLQQCIVCENTRFDAIPDIEWNKVESRLEKMRKISNAFISSIN